MNLKLYLITCFKDKIKLSIETTNNKKYNGKVVCCGEDYVELKCENSFVDKILITHQSIVAIEKIKIEAELKQKSE